QGPGEVGRRVDLHHRAGIGPDGPPRRAGGGRHRHPRRAVERAPAGLRGADGGSQGHPGGAPRAPGADVPEVVAPRPGRVRLGDPQDQCGEVRQEGPASRVLVVSERVSAAERWGEALREWAIPEEILRAAPESPWTYPVQVFRGRAEAAAADRTAQGPPSPSVRRALEALPE